MLIRLASAHQERAQAAALQLSQTAQPVQPEIVYDDVAARLDHLQAQLAFLAGIQEPLWQGYVDLLVRGGGTDHRDTAELRGVIPLRYSENSLLFADLRGQLGDDGNREGNWGLGFRQMLPSEWIIGAYAFYDLRATPSGNHFHQISFGVEAMTLRLGFPRQWISTRYDGCQTGAGRRARRRARGQ